MFTRLFEIDRKILSRDEEYFYFVKLIIDNGFETTFSMSNDVAQNLKILQEDLEIIANKCNAIKDGFTYCFNNVEDA